MSLSVLPTECIELILQELQYQENVQTLGRLLLVNRHFCTLTMPYFYIAAIEGPNKIDCFALCQLLLRQRLPKDVSPLLSAAFDVFPDEPAGTNTSSGGDQLATPTSAGIQIDYLSYVRSFFFFEEAILSHSRILKGHTPRLLSLAFTSKTGEIAHAFGEGGMDASLPFPLSINMEDIDMKTVRQCAVASALRHDLTWTLCTPFLENVRSMDIPLSDIGRYMPLLGRFKSLVSVEFKLDEFLELPGDMADVNPDQATELELCQNRKNLPFKDMLLFIRKHMELFPGQLQEADCHNSMKWRIEEIRCPFEIRDEMHWLLQSKKELKEINVFNWGLIARRIHEVNLDSVKVINLQTMSEEETGYASDMFSSHPPILSRCRSLRELSLGELGDSFSLKWAVDEKLAYRQLDGLDHTMDSSRRGALIVSPKETQLPLISLDIIAVSIPSSSRNLLDDIVFAFGDTLREITLGIYEVEDSTEDTPSVRVGEDWRLPQARFINIWSEDVQLLIDPNILQGAHENLEHLELFDTAGRHQCKDLCLISPPSNPLPRLHTINLLGGPALLFHPDTLLKTVNLKTLYLGPEPTELEENQDEESFGESGDHFSHWTWDWNLPSLDYLHLDGEFAYHFSFRMLEACPLLRHLQLDLQGQPRALKLKDFLSVTSETLSMDDGSLSWNAEVVSYSVESLILKRGWEMTDEILPILFLTVFPKLLWLTEYQTTGYSFQGWIAALKDHDRLRGAECGLHRPGNDEMIVKGTGLMSKPRPSRYFRDGKEVFNEDDDRPLFFFGGRRAWYYEKKINYPAYYEE